MPTVKDFEELRIWQEARRLSKNIYSITDTTEFKNDFKFRGQIRAAVGSIMDNIAEGFSRDGSKEFVQFLYISKASCAEVRSQLVRAFDIGYITEEVYAEYRQKCIDEEISISNFIKYLKKSDMKGLKFKKDDGNVPSNSET